MKSVSIWALINDHCSVVDRVVIHFCKFLQFDKHLSFADISAGHLGQNFQIRALIIGTKSAEWRNKVYSV